MAEKYLKLDVLRRTLTLRAIRVQERKESSVEMLEGANEVLSKVTYYCITVTQQVSSDPTWITYSCPNMPSTLMSFNKRV